MQLFIGNIPEDVNDYDLRKFFGMFGQEDASFRIYDTGSSGIPVHFGVATMNNRLDAIKAINDFHNSEMKGRKIIVREYLERSIYNERRAPAWAAQSYEGSERRRFDRRTAFQDVEMRDAITYDYHA
jgi:RNA recognition motif-containing protein